MNAKGSMEPEFIEVRIIGDDMDGTARTVFVNGEARKQGVGRPLLVQPGVHRVTIAGFRPKEVIVRGGDTTRELPSIVEFVYLEDALSKDP